MKGRRVWFLLGLAVLVVGLLAPGSAGEAAGNQAEGYCTADGTPVPTYWPPGWEGNYDAICIGKQFMVNSRNEIPLDAPTATWQEAYKERPDDWGRWAYVDINGHAIFNPYNDVDPYVVKSTGRTVIPLRFVSEALGAKVDWNAETRTVAIDWRGHQVQVTIGAQNAWIDGKEVTLDQPAQIWKERTMVPLRFIGESFGAKVEWDDGSSSIALTIPDFICSPAYCR